MTSLFHSFLERTSIRGAPRIVQHKQPGLRILWIVGILTLLALSLFNVLTIVINFFGYEQVSVLHNANLMQVSAEETDYPHGGICNLNPLSNDGRTDVLSKDEYVQVIDKAVAQYPGEIPPWALSHLKSHRGYFDFIGLENATKVGHQSENLMVACDTLYYVSSGAMFKVPCNLTQLKKTVSPEFFNCYSMGLDLATRSLGVPVGISLILHLDDDAGKIRDPFDRDDDNAQIRGIRFAYFRGGTVPDLWYTAVNVSPGFSNQVHVRVDQRYRLGPPYGDCLEFGTRSVQLYNLMGDPYRYSTLGCENACAMDELAAKCGCLDPALLATTKLENLQLGYCGTFTNDLNATISNLECARSVKGIAFLKCHQRCKPDCLNAVYSKYTATAEWPDKSQHLGFYKTIIKGKGFEDSYQVYQDILDLRDSGNETAARKLLSKTHRIENNFVKVRFFLEDLNFVYVYDTPKTSSLSMLSEVGGAFNLYIGINSILVIEIIELLFHLCKKLVNWRLPEQKRKDSLEITNQGNTQDRRNKMSVSM